ncbi:MoxR-like ATPase [Gammaproteobacteria bacterium]
METKRRPMDSSGGEGRGSPFDRDELPTLRDALSQVAGQAGKVVLGKDHQIRLALVCLVAGGHLLIEDLPGVGKTTLAHVLAKTLGLRFNRIQFTSDLMPGDVLGGAVYNREDRRFEFHPGPIFAQLILADEINRATPKTQSALLEAMEEHQVTVEGETRPLPEPFFVIATQNPAYQIGTFPLPESQLDRFLMRIDLGYPDRAAERALLRGRDRRELLTQVTPAMSPQALAAVQRRVPEIHVSDPLLDYLQALLEHTRRDPRFALGLSPRAGLALMRAAQAWALFAGRDYVLPEDLQTVLPHVVAHRLAPTSSGGEGGAQVVRHLLAAVPIP